MCLAFRSSQIHQDWAPKELRGATAPYRSFFLSSCKSLIRRGSSLRSSEQSLYLVHLHYLSCVGSLSNDRHNCFCLCSQWKVSGGKLVWGLLYPDISARSAPSTSESSSRKGPCWLYRSSRKQIGGTFEPWPGRRRRNELQEACARNK